MSHLSVMLDSIASKEPAKAAACEAIAGLAAAAASIAAVIRQPDAGAALGAIAVKAKTRKSACSDEEGPRDTGTGIDKQD